MSTSQPPASIPSAVDAPPAPAATPPQEPSKAVLALVLSLASWVTCGILLSIPSLILARHEIKAIEAGRRALDKLTLARVAFRISVANIAATALIVPLVAVLLVPIPLASIERARMTRAKRDIHDVAQAIARMRADTGNTSAACLTNRTHLIAAEPPAVCGELKPCRQVAVGYLCWGGPYLTAILPDPWRHPYRIDVNPETTEITIHSDGPDGVANTADDFPDYAP